MTTSDSRRETDSFEIAEQKIVNLLKRLKDKRVCPCCTARALAFHAAFLAECTAGTAEAIELFDSVIGQLREHNVPAPDPMPSTKAH